VKIIDKPMSMRGFGLKPEKRRGNCLLGKL